MTWPRSVARLCQRRSPLLRIRSHHEHARTARRHRSPKPSQSSLSSDALKRLLPKPSRRTLFLSIWSVVVVAVLVGGQEPYHLRSRHAGNKMNVDSPTDLAQFQSDLDKYGIRCEIAYRERRGDRWLTKTTGITLVEDAVRQARNLLEVHGETAVFSDHPVYGGRSIWQCRDPLLLNGPWVHTT